MRRITDDSWLGH